MATYATPQDVTDRWDGTAPSGRVETLLADAHTLLYRRLPDLDDRVAADPAVAGLARLVLVRAVTRFLDNPRGYQSETAGEVSYSYGSRGGVVGGVLGFSDEDLALLGVTSSPVGSIRLAVRDWCAPPPAGYW